MKKNKDKEKIDDRYEVIGFAALGSGLFQLRWGGELQCYDLYGHLTSSCKLFDRICTSPASRNPWENRSAHEYVIIESLSDNTILICYMEHWFSPMLSHESHYEVWTSDGTHKLPGEKGLCRARMFVLDIKSLEFFFTEKLYKKKDSNKLFIRKILVLPSAANQAMVSTKIRFITGADDGIVGLFECDTNKKHLTCLTVAHLPNNPSITGLVLLSTGNIGVVTNNATPCNMHIINSSTLAAIEIIKITELSTPGWNVENHHCIDAVPLSDGNVGIAFFTEVIGDQQVTQNKIQLLIWDPNTKKIASSIEIQPNEIISHSINPRPIKILSFPNGNIGYCNFVGDFICHRNVMRTGCFTMYEKGENEYTLTMTYSISPNTFTKALRDYVVCCSRSGNLTFYNNPAAVYLHSIIDFFSGTDKPEILSKDVINIICDYIGFFSLRARTKTPALRGAKVHEPRHQCIIS